MNFLNETSVLVFAKLAIFLQMDLNPEPQVFVYELSGSGFESSCSHL